MTELVIRPAIATDIIHLINIDHNFSSDHVWQLHYHKETRYIEATFREVRLPRSVQVKYPRDPERLKEEWTHKAEILIAEIDRRPAGYICISITHSPLTCWISDLVVMRAMRRQGIGTALIQKAVQWVRDHNGNKIVLELQPKNYAGIRLATKLGFEFSGYVDQYFPNLDIGLFFSRGVK